MTNFITNECASLAEVQVETARLDSAAIVPLQIDDGGVVKKVDNFVGVYNHSQGKFCAAVVPQYNLVQHKDYFDSFAGALDRLGLSYKMTMKQVGNRAFADIEFTERNLKFEKLNEEFTTGIRLINSYDKSRGLYVVPRFTRLACTNGMIITRSAKAVSIKHHSKIVQEIGAFVETRLSEIINHNSDLKTWVSTSMEDSIEWLTACRIVGKLFTQIKHREEILKRLGIAVIEITDKKKNKKQISYVWNDNSEKVEKLNRWDIYNAITNYLTFGEHITPHIEDMFHRHAEKLLLTPLAKMPLEKEVVLNA